MPKYKHQPIAVPVDWKIIRNEFYDIDPADDVPDDDKYNFIYIQEDLLWLQKGLYNLDLGWYGGDNLTDELAGYRIHLYRGKNWNDCQLLEKTRSKNKEEIASRINELLSAVSSGDFDGLEGYTIDETSSIDFSDFDKYRIRK